MPSSQRKQPARETSAQEAYRLAQAIDRAKDRAARNKALQAILERLDAARRDNAESYVAARVRRETSAELS